LGGGGGSLKSGQARERGDLGVQSGMRASDLNKSSSPIILFWSFISKGRL
jgi:hypothetical protein